MRGTTSTPAAKAPSPQLRLVDPRERHPGFLRMTLCRSWSETDEQGNLFIVEVRKDDRTGMVVRGRFAL